MILRWICSDPIVMQCCCCWFCCCRPSQPKVSRSCLPSVWIVVAIFESLFFFLCFWLWVFFSLSQIKTNWLYLGFLLSNWTLWAKLEENCTLTQNRHVFRKLCSIFPYFHYVPSHIANDVKICKFLPQDPPGNKNSYYIVDPQVRWYVRKLRPAITTLKSVACIPTEKCIIAWL